MADGERHRILAHPAGEAPASNLIAVLQLCITFATVITIAAQGIFVLNVAVTLLRNAHARDTNPWRAASLEWVAAASAFSAGAITVHRGAYEFLPSGIGRNGDDFLPQTVPSAEALLEPPHAANPGAASLNPLGST